MYDSSGSSPAERISSSSDSFPPAGDAASCCARFLTFRAARMAVTFSQPRRSPRPPYSASFGRPPSRPTSSSWRSTCVSSVTPSGVSRALSPARRISITYVVSKARIASGTPRTHAHARKSALRSRSSAGGPSAVRSVT